MQLAPLALPAHPFVFLSVPPAGTVQQEKVFGVILAVQPCDSGLCLSQQFNVQWPVLGRRICPVCDQRKVKFTVYIGQVMNLQPIDHFVNVIARCQECRHRHQGAIGFRYAVTQRQSGKN